MADVGANDRPEQGDEGQKQKSETAPVGLGLHAIKNQHERGKNGACGVMDRRRIIAHEDKALGDEALEQKGRREKQRLP